MSKRVHFPSEEPLEALAENLKLKVLGVEQGPERVCIIEMAGFGSLWMHMLTRTSSSRCRSHNVVFHGLEISSIDRYPLLTFIAETKMRYRRVHLRGDPT